MKNPFRTLPFAMAALLAASALCLAEDEKPKRPAGPGGPGGRPDPAARLEMMAEKLSLTAEQKAKLKDVLAKTAEKMKTIRESEAGEIKEILTPEQREKMKEMRPAGRADRPARKGKKPADA